LVFKKQFKFSIKKIANSTINHYLIVVYDIDGTLIAEICPTGKRLVLYKCALPRLKDFELCQKNE
jgi:hypothetical protein